MIDIGVDIGGTFTDAVLLKDGKAIYSLKVSTTSSDFIVGILRAVDKVLKIAGCKANEVDRFIHGTTIATNAIIQRTGATIGILMTKGFEDTLETGRQRREQMYNFLIDPEVPLFLCPRRRRVGIDERIDANGDVLTPLNEEDVIRSVQYLSSRFGVKAVAVCYLFSFLNPAHEIRTKEIIQKEFPDISVSISSEIDPAFREYERLCVTAFDAYLRPVIENYISHLDKEMKRSGLSANLQIMQSRGGITSANVSVGKPVTTFLSGPAAGAIAGKYAGQLSGFSNIITLDMGGTSCDVALINEGNLDVATEGNISGYSIRVPMVDVRTIGAGGGSIAWLDSGSGLRVGPQSAGAEPGPACYNAGGNEPTVTDASLVLGYLNPDFLAGGERKLDFDASMRAIESIAKPLGLTIMECAAGIHRVINSTMAGLVRLMTVSRGIDPRNYALLLLGGAGPVHGGGLVNDLAISTLVIPQVPGVLSAFGLLVANIEHDSGKTFGMTFREFDYTKAREIYQELDAKCAEMMNRNNINRDEVRISHSADIRYVGQSHSIEILFNDKETTEEGVEEAVNKFRIRHKEIYGHKSMEDDVEFLNLRAVHFFALPNPEIEQKTVRSSLDDACKGFRKAFFPEFGDYRKISVYDRNELFAGVEIKGPAIIEQADTTTVVYPNQICQCDEKMNLIIKVRRS